jgi:hypothetical protein
VTGSDTVDVPAFGPDMYADAALRQLQHRKASLAKIKNKDKRSAVYHKLKSKTREVRVEMRKKRHRAVEEAREKGLPAPAKRVSAAATPWLIDAAICVCACRCTDVCVWALPTGDVARLCAGADSNHGGIVAGV